MDTRKPIRYPQNDSQQDAELLKTNFQHHGRAGKERQRRRCDTELKRRRRHLNWLSNVREQGFGLVPGVLRDPEVERLLAQLCGLQVARSRAGIRHAMKIPSIAKLASDERLLSIATGPLGSRAIPFRATVFDKSVSAN
jgi:hypothetical protein